MPVAPSSAPPMKANVHTNGNVVQQAKQEFDVNIYLLIR